MRKYLAAAVVIVAGFAAFAATCTVSNSSFTEINGRELILLSGKGDGSESFTPSKVGAGAGGGAPRKEESLEEFPEALDAEDDDLPF